ncbi:MAG TPA: translocation/assembly module TamB domain-containing protein [Deltaproteobacteria bacterium]|nr:translocation/assembly module TamB domain-containing protein [Deltaproteobacteria bacterium]
MRKAIVILAALSVTAAALAAAVILAAQAYFSTSEGAARLLGFVNTLYPGEIRGEKIEVDLVAQEVTILEPVILAPGGRKVLEADRAFLKTDLARLLRKDLVFVTIEIDRPLFLLELDEDGWLTIESAFVEKTPGPAPVDVHIRRLVSRGATIEYRDDQAAPVVRLDDTDLAMQASFERDSVLHLSSPRTSPSLFVSGRRVFLGSGKASCSIINDRITGIDVHLTSGSTTAAMKGAVSEMSQKAKLDLEFTVNGAASYLENLFGTGWDLKGAVQATVRASGAWDEPDLDISLAGPVATIKGRGIGPVSARGKIHERFLTIDHFCVPFASGDLKAQGSLDLRGVFPEGLFEGVKEEDALAYELSVTGTSLSLQEIPGVPEGVTGRLSPVVRIKGSGVSPSKRRVEASFDAVCRALTAPPLLSRDDARVRGRVSSSAGRLTIAKLEAQASGIEASLSGLIDLAGASMDVTGQVSSPKSSTLLKRIAGVDGSGALRSGFRAAGPFKSPEIAFEASFSGGTIGDVRLGDVSLRGKVTRASTLEIEDLTIRNGGSTVAASGTVGLFAPFPRLAGDPSLSLEVRLDHADPSSFVPGVPVSGAVDGTAEISGSVRSPRATFALEGSDMSVSGVDLGKADARGNLEGGVLEVEGMGLSLGASRVEAYGSVTLLDARGRLLADPGLAMSAKGTGIRLEDLWGKAQGSASFDATITGTLAHPQGSASLTSGKVTIMGQAFTSAEIALRADGDIVWLDRAVLTIAPGENINARGFVTMGGAYEFSLGTPGIEARHIGALGRYESLGGIVFLTASGKGTLDNPTLSGRVSAASLKYGDTPLEDMTFSFDLSDKILSIQGDWDFHVDARYDLGRGVLEAEALFAETELGQLFVLAGRKDFSGRLTGRLFARGNPERPRDMEATAEISSVDVFHEGSLLVQARDVNAAYSKGRVNLPQTRVSLAQGGLIDIQASGDPTHSFVVDLDGVVPLTSLGLFDDDFWDATGSVRVLAQVVTAGSKGTVKGTAGLEDLSWTIPANSQRIHSVNGKIRFEGDRVSLEDITGRLDTGSFQLGGVVLLDGLRPKTAEVFCQARALPLAIPDTMDLVMDLEASLDYGTSSPRLWADVSLTDGVYYRDARVDLFSGVIGRVLLRQREEELKAPRIPPPLASIPLEVTVRRRGNVKVENNIASLDINPDLKIAGTLGQPVVNGRITVTEGVVTFQNNDFEVTRGLIDFLDPNRTRPVVDISANTRVRDWEITIALEGRLEELKFTLSSRPEEDPSDILSLLVVGKTSRELASQQSGLSVSPTGMIAELLTSTYGGRIKKTTTLDILEFKASEFATTTGEESMTLLVGKELSRRLTVKYEMTTKNAETVQKAIAEYKILENLLLGGYQGTDGIFGVDIFYRRRFR